MRISIRPTDSGYSNYVVARAHGRRASVKLNGELQTCAVTADSDCGMVVRLAKGANGEMTYDADRQCIADEVVHGKVDIEFADEMVLG